MRPRLCCTHMLFEAEGTSPILQPMCHVPAMRCSGMCVSTASLRGKKLSQAKDRVKAAKSELEGAKKVLRKREQAVQEAAAEAEAADKEGGELARKVVEAEAGVAALRSELQVRQKGKL